MNSAYAVGKCQTMCPTDELQMRQREKLLHLFEMVQGTEKAPIADPERTVKMYNRSAAGKSMTNENYLRPPDVLLKTVTFLLNEVIQDKRGIWLMKYDFISDRLRAVRQDMIIQNVPRAYAIYLLEPMVRFHAYAAYKLCDQDIFKFDPHLNKKTLQECLNNLLILYEQTESFVGDYDKNFLDHINKSRPFFETLNLVLNLGNEEILFRIICLATKWKTPVVKTASLIAVNYMRKNFVKVCRNIRNLPPLLAAVLILQLPTIRRNALEIMSVAYSSKNLRISLNDIKNLLMYNSENEIRDDAKLYGLDIKENSVRFDKISFKDSSEVILPRKLSILEEHFKNMNESSFLLFGDDSTSELSGLFNLLSL